MINEIKLLTPNRYPDINLSLPLSLSLSLSLVAEVRSVGGPACQREREEGLAHIYKENRTSPFA